MTRFFIETPPKQKQIELLGGEVHHLLHVRRAQPGTTITLFDAQGTEYQAQILSCTRKSVSLEILSQRQAKTTNTVDLCLAQGILKAKAWELLLQKAMELGLKQLQPLHSQYISSKHAAGNPQRWQKIIIAAAKQCGRNDLLTILPSVTFSQFVANNDSQLRLLAHNRPGLPPLKTVLDQHPDKPQKIIAAIGPEGGFSEAEIDEAQHNGFTLVSLGPHTMRAETAAIAMVANILFFYQR